MKRIIDGIRYDTQAAGIAEVACFEYSYPSQGDYIDQSLYKGAGGNWFINDRGGDIGGSRGNLGSGISAMTPEEALEWLEARGCTDAIEEHFGDEVVDA